MSANNPVRLMPFKFSTKTCFVLEFGHMYIRFYSNRSQVLLAGNPYEIASPYTAPTGTPLNQTVIFQLQFTQIEDIIYITHPDFPVFSLTRITDTNWVLAEVGWLEADGSQAMPPMLDQNNTGTTITPSAATGSINLVASSALFQSGHVGSFWQISQIRTAQVLAVDLGVLLNGSSSAITIIGAWTFTTTGVWDSNLSVERSDDAGASWHAVVAVSTEQSANFNIPGTAVTTGLYRITQSGWTPPINPGVVGPHAYITCDDAFIFGLVKITGVTDSTHADADVLIDLDDPNPTVYWSEGAFSDVRGYPKAVCTFQQRLWFANTTFEPQRVWGSMTGDIENFDRTNTTLATSSIAIDLAADKKGPIYWLATGLDLFAGLAGAEWVITAPDSTKAITTSNIEAKQHSENGNAEFVPAMPVGDALIYCERRAKSLMQMMFSIGTSKYMSQKLTVLANHITKPGLVQMDVQQQFDEQIILWAVTSDGRLVGLTYDLEQEVIAWHQHNTGGENGDIFLSVACVYGAENSDSDDVYLAVQRNIGGVGTVFVEILSTTDWQEPEGDPNTAIYCDCATQKIVQTNLCTNGDFSSGLTGWTDHGPNFGGNSATTDPSAPSKNHTVAVMQGAGTIDFSGRAITTIAGHTYTMSCYLKSDGLTPNEFSLKWNGTTILDQVNVAAQGYTQIIFTGLVATGASTDFQFGGFNTPGALVITNIVITDEATTTTITGLAELNGRQVVAVVNNMVIGRFTVIGGSIEIPSLASVEGEVVVTVGLDYESDIQPVSIDRDDRLGITQAEQKTIGKVYPIFLNTLGGIINVGNADVAVPQSQNPDLNSTPAFINGMVEVPVNGPHTRLPVLIVKQVDPLPLTLLALNVEYSRTGTP